MTTRGGKGSPFQPGDKAISSRVLNDLVDDVESLLQISGPRVKDVGNLFIEEEERDLFVAELIDVAWDDVGFGSGSGSGTGGWKYSWIERFPSRDGPGYDAGEYARYGTLTKNPAYPLNDRKVAVGLYVWMREKSHTTRTDVDYEMVYEFLDAFEDEAPGSGSGSGDGDNVLTLVQQRCVDGVLTDTTYRITFPVGTVIEVL